MISIIEIETKLACGGVDALIMENILISKKKAHNECIEGIRKFSGTFYSFINAYNDSISPLCELQSFLEPAKMRRQIEFLHNAYIKGWEIFTVQISGQFIAEHSAIIETIDDLLLNGY